MSEYGFTEEIGLRMNDFDANQHVNNTAFVSFLQDARANYFRSLWGEDWTESSVVIATLDIDFLAPIVEGRDPTVVERIHRDLREQARAAYQSVVPFPAISGVDVALWDLRGKLRDEPVSALLGGRCHDAVRGYATGH